MILKWRPTRRSLVGVDMPGFCRKCAASLAVWAVLSNSGFLFGQDADREAAEVENVLSRALQVLGVDGDSPPESFNRVRGAEEAGRVLETARSLARDKRSTESLRDLTDKLARKQDFTSARDAATSISEGQMRDRVLSLLTLAKAENKSGRNGQAWLTLFEAHQAALKLTDENDAIAVFRELQSVEATLKASMDNDTVSRSMPLEPSTSEVLSDVVRNGLPEAGFREIEIVSKGGGVSREPAVVAHPFYYSGNRCFQGPMLSGGKTILQFTHPRCGCDVSVPVVLPAGAPIVRYQKDSVEYLYPKVTVEIEFHKRDRFEVEYHNVGSRYARLLKSFRGTSLRGRVRRANGTTDLADNVAGIAVRRPLDVLTRLPFLSDLLKKGDKRVPGTLRQPSSN